MVELEGGGGQEEAWRGTARESTCLALPDETPRSHDVGDDLDLDGGTRRGDEGRHELGLIERPHGRAHQVALEALLEVLEAH